MVKKKSSRRFTAAEIGILRMLWNEKSVTLSQAHRAMQQRGESVGYTTIQTRLERLVEKGVVCKGGKRPAEYAALVDPSEVSGPLLELLLDRVAGPVPLVAQLVQDPSVTTSDLQAMKDLIAQAERRQRRQSRKEPSE